MNISCRSLLAAMLLSGVFASLPAAENAYSRIGQDSMTVIDDTGWYLEEYDGLGRPFRGSRWENGEIVSRTDWTYPEDSAQCETSIVTGASGSEETVYDSRGSEIRITRKDGNGNVVSQTDRVWDEGRREIARETRVGTATTREEWQYAGDGALTARKLYKNGVCVFTADYETETVWTETVYSNGSPLYSQRYVDGKKAVKP